MRGTRVFPVSSYSEAGPAPLQSSTARHHSTTMSGKRKYSETDFCDENDGYSSFSSGDRKKKRGEIEKKRRDRINDCLNQIKELVPTACEKSNVNKLEKVEILQMAVDHLKLLQSGEAGRGAEQHSAGFRECMGEVSRYLVAVEGMHIEEPLRLRLMSHLHAFSATRGPASSQYPSPYPALSSYTYPDSEQYPGRGQRSSCYPHYRPWGDAGSLY